MNRAITRKNKVSYKVIIFWSIIGFLTLFFVGYVIYRFVEQLNVQTFEDINNLTGDQIFEQSGTYYVFVYSKKGIEGHDDILTKKAELEQTIENYLTYAKRNEGAYKLYGMNVDIGNDNYGNYGALVFGTQTTNVRNVTNFKQFKVHVDDLPLLVKISGGRVVEQYITVNEIKAELETTMGIG